MKYGKIIDFKETPTKFCIFSSLIYWMKLQDVEVSSFSLRIGIGFRSVNIWMPNERGSLKDSPGCQLFTAALL